MQKREAKRVGWRFKQRSAASRGEGTSANGPHLLRCRCTRLEPALSPLTSLDRRLTVQRSKITKSAGRPRIRVRRSPPPFRALAHVCVDARRGRGFASPGFSSGPVRPIRYGVVAYGETKGEEVSHEYLVGLLYRLGIPSSAPPTSPCPPSSLWLKLNVSGEITSQ